MNGVRYRETIKPGFSSLWIDNAVIDSLLILKNGAEINHSDTIPNPVNYDTTINKRFI